MAGTRDIEGRISPIDMLKSPNLTKICAPMVRYSKLGFRTLVKKYGCDLTFTPMIISDAFIQSKKARDSDFTTNPDDRPLIVQFASKNATELATAAEIVVPFSDGVDLNCGCPQRWAIADGYGCCLLRSPDLIKDMVTQARNRVPADFTISIKIRIDKDMRKTVDLCQKAQSAGVSWISVHGRTKDQRHQPVDYSTIKTVKDSLDVPVVANGDIKSIYDARNVQNLTGVDGVMAARGLLNNPAMFAGYDYTPIECLKDWVDISLSVGTHFSVFHHHIMEMCEQLMPKYEKRLFNTLSTTSAVLEYLRTNYGV
ncbi:tRNA-dihydrouridine(20a/20b) synthase [NAD(P)+]-like [Tubulanus polymorphus]|uniref:tRNA-dihydrouridine(20a/20b) synthase [NAD(P)+]-like n=1 Tax=Tubulanus polymorphus TaxID=672921 RepID=UPI003DA350EE